MRDSVAAKSFSFPEVWIPPVQLGSVGLGHACPEPGGVTVLPPSAARVASPPLNFNPEGGEIKFILFTAWFITRAGVTSWR